MEDTRSVKANLKDILKRHLFSKGALTGIIVILILLAAVVALNSIVLPLFGYKFGYDSGRFGVMEYIRYSKDESRVLNMLVNDTPALGAIPSFQYLISRTGLSANELRKCLNSLAEKGDVTLDDNGIIRKVFPWADTESNFNVFLIDGKDSTIGPLPAVSALHAFSVAPLFAAKTRVTGIFKDTGEPVIIEIENNQIVYTSHIAAIVYMTEDYENTEFYFSPEGAEADHPDDFDIKKAIRLDRALLIANIMAKEIKDKIEK